MSVVIPSLRGAIAVPGWAKNDLWRRARAVPSLDLRFADNKSLTDAVTGASLVTFTRSSSGTYTDSAGVLQTAVTNLLLRSEEIGVSPWNLGGATTVTANSTVAPDGQTTADTVNTIAAGIDVTSGSATITASATVTASIYVKTGGTVPFVRVQIWDNSANGFRVWVNNSTGAVGTLAAIGTGTVATASSTPVGGGWFRIALTGTCGTSTSPVIAMAGADADGSFARTAGQTYIVWGAQLEQSTTVGEYIPTTSTINSAPRFDHNPTTGESLGLLVEEQRTNLITSSSDIVGYFTEQSSTGTANAAAAPDGTVTADLLVPNTSPSSHTCFNTSISFSASTTYSYSIFVKPNGYSWLQLLFTSGFNNPTAWVNFDLTGAGSFGFTGGGEISKKIESYPGGWYRCTITTTSGAAPALGGPAYLVLDSNRNGRDANYAGDGTSGIYLWGAQLEAGAFPTSYIPTTTAATTRSADVASITGSAFSGWYRQDEGTMFADAKEYPFASSASRAFYGFVNTGDVNSNFVRQWIWSGATGFVSNSVYTSTAGPVAADFGTAVVNEQKRFALAVKANDFAKAYNGSGLATDATGAMPNGIDAVWIGSTSGALLLSGHIRRLCYWNQRLANSTLQQITQ